MAKQFLILVAIATLTGAIAAQAPALKIVVIEGENAVNIIQRKTAVRAVVEVRDRNNLPVSGATVTFAVSGQGSATIAGGASTLTVTTNAAGQAALAGVTPASTGSLQISVAASFKDLAASATIVQTNVATAASDSGSSTSPNPCRFVASPIFVESPKAGGSFVVTVTVANPGCDSAVWTVTNVPSYGSVDRTGGTGDGVVTVTLGAYTLDGARTGAMSIAGVVINFRQS